MRSLGPTRTIVEHFVASLMVLCGFAFAGTRAAHGQSPSLEVDLRAMKAGKDGFAAPIAGGGRARLTLVPDLQEAAERHLADSEIPYGAVVMISIPDGKILTLAGRSELDPRMGPVDLALKAWAPAASIFKIVTAAALVTAGGISPDAKACYAGGLHGIGPQDLRDNPRLDKRCESLKVAVGRSQNVVVAKLALKHLSPSSLGRTARDFGFGQRIPFVADLEVSAAKMPSDDLEFARAAAGFFHSSLSPLHGALIAATVANGGLMPGPILVRRATDGSGRPRPIPTPRGRRVVGPKTARALGAMMETTVTLGTARSSFRDRRGRKFLPFAVAGKTGSLNYRGRKGDPPMPRAGLVSNYLQYNWFVGYAPCEKPKVAFATIVANPAKWRIKATYLARRMLEAWWAKEKSDKAKASAAKAPQTASSPDGRRDGRTVSAASTSNRSASRDGLPKI
ncbi:MAG: penicillin-binding protein [Deltaproteobacteria bacterium]|nr:penicillin-binding protein [Deltaproteobacteria bacterium]